ncbi:hypothetical protein RMSM_02955 [Rhodopirellula maiorica SM1]|uniref:Uncharacterized protein n=1 Tax=Rhodopirellula maiorica SM1 TaxID=1265738 RepID=M5S1Q9_9BACT|nr:hypothetical protein RMSM_02955 [Rhodopirellula maiorica SM1]
MAIVGLLRHHRYGKSRFLRNADVTEHPRVGGNKHLGIAFDNEYEP